MAHENRRRAHFEVRHQGSWQCASARAAARLLNEQFPDLHLGATAVESLCKRPPKSWVRCALRARNVSIVRLKDSVDLVLEPDIKETRAP